MFLSWMFNREIDELNSILQTEGLGVDRNSDISSQLDQISHLIDKMEYAVWYRGEDSKKYLHSRAQEIKGLINSIKSVLPKARLGKSARGDIERQMFSKLSAGENPEEINAQMRKNYPSLSDRQMGNISKKVSKYHQSVNPYIS